MAIHLVQRSQAHEACITSCAPDDIIVLTGEGVLAGLVVAGLERDVMRSYATRSDVIERAIGDRINDSITLITDEELVELCAIHSPVVSWNHP